MDIFKTEKELKLEQILYINTQILEFHVLQVSHRAACVANHLSIWEKCDNYHIIIIINYHIENFVNPVVHTQNIESSWRHMKKRLC